MQIAFYRVIQEMSEQTGKEISVEDITGALRRSYHVGGPQYEGRLVLRSYNLVDANPTANGTPANGFDDDDQAANDRTHDRQRSLTARVSVDGIVRNISGSGNGPLSSFMDALYKDLGITLSIREYSEHAIGGGSDVKAASYVELVPPEADIKDKTTGGFWGVGVDSDITGSGLKAVLSAANGALGDKQIKGFTFPK